jgi:hypothetical protein
MNAPNAVPAFAVVGEPNEGKTTLIATLAEADWAEVDKRAGTTQKRTSYTATLDGIPILQFIDTPGFENTATLREWFDANKDQRVDLATAFVDAHREVPSLRAECEILAALQNSAVIYVIDGSRPVRREDVDQMEILRLCSANRIAVLNCKTSDTRCLPEWRQLLGRSFTWKEFDAHHVNFEDRIDLLKSIAVVMPAWQAEMEQVVARYQEAWEGRMIDCRDRLMELIEDTVNLRVSVPIKRSGDVSRAGKIAQADFEIKIRECEQRFRKHIRRLFRHNRTDWTLPTGDLLDEDLFSERVWKLFGLSRRQMVIAGAAMGAVIGGGIDIMVGGLSLLAGSLFGAAVGAVGAWLVAEKAVEIELPRWGPLRAFPGSQKLAQAEECVVARLLPKSNLVWILLDRALAYTACAATWSHGRREEKPQDVGADDQRLGVSSRWSAHEKLPLIQWIGFLYSGKTSDQRCRKAQLATEDFLLGQIRAVGAGPVLTPSSQLSIPIEAPSHTPR